MVRCWPSVELADGRAARRKGLLGRDDFDGVLRLKARSVHTIGMRFGVDVSVLRPRRHGQAGRDHVDLAGVAPAAASTIVFEARAGTFREWNLRPGDRLEVR